MQVSFHHRLYLKTLWPAVCWHTCCPLPEQLQSSTFDAFVALSLQKRTHSIRTLSQCKAACDLEECRHISMYLLPLSLACMLSLLAGHYIAPATCASMSILDLQLHPHAHV